MKHLIICIIAIILLTNQQCLASCDFSTIKKVDNGYLYSTECHGEVGKIKKAKEELEVAIEERKKQVEKLTESIKLKDLALDTADQRTMNWRQESYNQYERLLKQQQMNDYSKWIYFGLGIFVMGAATYSASRLK